MWRGLKPAGVSPRREQEPQAKARATDGSQWFANSGGISMRFMMIVKANKDTEAGVMPEEKLIAAMT